MVVFLLVHLGDVGLLLEIDHRGIVFHRLDYLLFLEDTLLKVLHPVHHLGVELAVPVAEVVLIQLGLYLVHLRIAVF